MIKIMYCLTGRNHFKAYSNIKICFYFLISISESQDYAKGFGARVIGKPFLTRLRCLTLCLNMLTTELKTISIPQVVPLPAPGFISLKQCPLLLLYIQSIFNKLACLLNTPKENTCSIDHPHLRDLTILPRLASNPQNTVILPPLAFLLSGNLDAHHQAWLARLPTPTLPPALCHQGSNLEPNTI